MSKANRQDVKLTFKHNGEVYGNDRFLIDLIPGKSFEEAVAEKAGKSRYAIEGVDFELDVETIELAAA
jgi:hypothetical protein